MLYLPKTTPSAGIRGIRIGNLFLPLSEEVPAVGQKGLYVQNAGRKLFLPLKEDDQLLAAGQPGISIKTKNGRLFIAVMDEFAIPDDPVFYLSCSQDTDVAETGQTLSKNGTVSTTTVDGVPCWHFDKSVVYINDLLIDMTKPFTMSVFAKEPTLNADHLYGILGIGTSSSHGQNLGYNSWNTPPIVTCYGRNGGADYSAYNTDLNLGDVTGKWTHQAYVFDGVTATGYRDGVAIESSTTRLPINVSGSVSVGTSYGSSSGYDELVNTDVAGVRIYDRALNASEVMALAKEFTPTA